MGNPTVNPLSEIRHDGGFIVSIGNGHQSFDTGSISAANSPILAGTVVGKLTTGGTLAPSLPTATDGSQTPVGVVYATLRASLGVQQCVYVARQAEVNGSELIFATGATAPQIVTLTAGLAAIGILAR